MIPAGSQTPTCMVRLSFLNQSSAYNTYLAIPSLCYEYLTYVTPARVKRQAVVIRCCCNAKHPWRRSRSGMLSSVFPKRPDTGKPETAWSKD